MNSGTYFGPERRRVPRDVRHSFGTVFVKLDGYWMAREILVVDTTANSVRVRTLPDLRQYDFRLKLDDGEPLFAPRISRSEKRSDHWEFTMALGPEIPPDTLAALPVRYDFPRPVNA